ncbi:alanine/glycine:cation symporter family protein [Nesterenkonia ebinurensis]|uniref:alanine/glycine:cation symporter family protein n=1 Tax=Nesterenkonia ebinurensis TaxID=2608252 RepID=UPI00123E0A3A|nr:alanine/glycine:cation symporter family protein [Nesterenkonia ebinurensis]
MSLTGYLRAAELPETFLDDFAAWIDSWFGNIASGFESVILWGFEGQDDIPIRIVVLWSIIAAIGFTIYFKGVQFTGFTTALEAVRGKWSKKDDPGEISHFQALSAALSGTVGLGNIGGVAAALYLGGPGATFWMIVIGLFAMCTKLVECTLGVKYRYIDEDGVVHGGPFQYLKVAFRKLGTVPVAIITGVFAISIIAFGVGGGGMYQTNQVMMQTISITGGETSPLATGAGALIFGIIFAALIGLVIIGGVKSLGRVAGTLVPIMAVVYVASGLIVLLVNITNIPAAFGEIISGAFSPEAGFGGIIGVIIMGAQRAAFSNEAGIGSAPIAHAAVKTKRPASEGFVAALEPFIDTVVVCTMTALVIMLAFPDYVERHAAGELTGAVSDTSDAFETVLPWFPYLLFFAVVCFAFSSIVTWAYYGNQAWRHLFGKSDLKDNIFRSIVLVFVVLGCLTSFGSILDFADAALFLCIFINVIGCVILAPKVKKEIQSYVAARKAGTLLEDPEEDSQEDKEAYAFIAATMRGQKSTDSASL